MIQAALGTIDPEVVYAYLGMAGITPDAQVASQVDRCIRLIEKASVPRAVYRSFPLAKEENGCRPEGTSLLLTGSDIRAHLDGCHGVLFFALTLGNAVETLLMRTQVSNVADAVILDACASAAVESACDKLTEDLKSEYLEKKLYLTGRFSPGYGDLPLTLQGDLLTVLNAQRTIGLTASETSILLPRKSVTAILGISDTPRSGKPAGCSHCALKDKCPYRKKGKTCES